MAKALGSSVMVSYCVLSSGDYVSAKVYTYLAISGVALVKTSHSTSLRTLSQYTYFRHPLSMMISLAQIDQVQVS